MAVLGVAPESLLYVVSIFGGVVVCLIQLVPLPSLLAAVAILSLLLYCRFCAGRMWVK